MEQELEVYETEETCPGCDSRVALTRRGVLLEATCDCGALLVA